MLEYLKKQVFEFRSKNFLLRNDYNELKLAHSHLHDQYSGISSSYEALGKHCTNLSLSNKKLIEQSTNDKKQLFETKKELKISLFQHKAEMRKVTDLMRAKDKDSAETISYLEAELASLRAIARNNISREKKVVKTRPAAASQSSLSMKKQEMTKKPVKSSLSQKAGAKKTRANFGRKNAPPPLSAPSMDDDEWGHDKFHATHGSSGRSSPPSSSLQRQGSKKKGNSKKSLKDFKKSNASSPRVVSPDQKMNRNSSTSSLKEAVTTTDSSSKRSSLASAATTKKSSLASRAKTAKN